MIVCHCHAVSDRDIVAAAERGAQRLADVQRDCRAGTDCRGCQPRIERILASIGTATTRVAVAG